MTDDQTIKYYLLGCAVQFTYILYTFATNKDEEGNYKALTMDREAKKEGFNGIWYMFIFFGAMTIMFWPLWLIKKLGVIFMKGIWK